MERLAADKDKENYILVYSASSHLDMRILYFQISTGAVDTRAPADSKPKNDIISIVMIFLLRTCLVYLY